MSLTSATAGLSGFAGGSKWGLSHFRLKRSDDAGDVIQSPFRFV